MIDKDGLSLTIPNDAARAITVALIADSIECLKTLKERGLEDRDDKKYLKALKRAMKYFATDEELEQLGFNSTCEICNGSKG